MSKRTLQRRIMKSGTSYSKIVDPARFHVTRRMLLDSDMKVQDVSGLLDYGHPTHFVRAFRRIVGASPQAFRQVNAS